MLSKLMLAAGLVVLCAACSSAVTPTAASSPTAATEESTSAVEAVMQTTPDSPAWLPTPLTNAVTGETFRLSDFTGKTVYVELMATWCTNCRAQQREVVKVKQQLGDVNYVFVSLSVEPNDTIDGLKQYRQREGFPWTFALVPPDMLRALVGQFGRVVTNPTSTPHFVISPDGAVSQLSTGHDSADQLVAKITAAAGA